jgi:hypothetical protein
MKTRSQKAAVEKKRNVIVWDREKDTRTKIGEASHNHDAMDMAKASGLAPPNFNWTIVDETEDDYVLTFAKGELYSGLDPGRKHIARPKTKITPVLPEKLLGELRTPLSLLEPPIQKSQELSTTLSSPRNLSRPLFALKIQRSELGESLVTFWELARHQKASFSAKISIRKSCSQ